MEGDTFDYHFHEVEVIRHANVDFYHPGGGQDVTCETDSFLGDQTGLLKLRENQHMFAEYIEGNPGVTTAPVSFETDEGSHIYFPQTTNIYGARSLFEGRVVGIIDLIIASGAIIEVAGTTQTALEQNGQERRVEMYRSHTKVEE